MTARGWGVAALGLLLVGIAIYGCNRTRGTDSTTTTDTALEQPTETESEKAPPAPMQPLLEGWDKPAVALMLSGAEHGYLEPCGCSLTQSGGVSRRDDLFQKLKDRGWTVVGLDAGGLVKRNRRQDQIKFEMMLDAFRQMNYAAVALGLEDLRLGPDFLLTQQVVDPEHAEAGVSLLAANVTLFETPDLGTPIRSKIVKVGDVTIGVTAIFGESLWEQIAPQGVNTNITFTSPAEALAPVLAEWETAQPALRVLLSHGTVNEAKALAEKFPTFQLVIASGGPEDGEPRPTKVGDAWVTVVGQKGKNVGIIGFYPDNDKQPLRFELVNLDNRRFNTTSAMEDVMRRYQQQLRDEQIATSPELQKTHPSGHQFVGAAKCGECHTKAYGKWKESKHAHAYETLKIGRKGQEATWISRVHDPECLACHVTGWNPQEVLRYDSGFLSEQATPHLLGQQCENCHGPGSVHVALEEAWKKDYKSVDRAELDAARKAAHRVLETAKKHTCFECHDLDNSPGFKFDEYWKKVEHRGRD